MIYLFYMYFVCMLYRIYCMNPYITDIKFTFLRMLSYLRLCFTPLRIELCSIAFRIELCLYLFSIYASLTVIAILV